MILIIGGAWQGKLNFAKETFGITNADVFTCTDGKIDFSKRCIDRLEEFSLHHPDPIGYFEVHREQWRDSIMILRDIFCGVVPCSAEERAWRQNTGRLAQYLGQEADRVSRIFCGLEQRLK